MKLKLNTLLTALLLSGTCVAASALTISATPSGTGVNLLSNSCVRDTTVGTTVQGCLNTDNTFLVDLTSSESLVIAGGQATLDASDGTFTDLTISDITTLVLNVDATTDGTITFTDGSGPLFSQTFALDGSGQNFFTITGIVGDLSFTVAGTQVADVSQIRVTSAIPEPETYALMLAGLGALGFVARRRKAVR